MKRIKILSAVLCAAMLLSLCGLFSSCAGEKIGTATVSKKSEKIDLSGYNVVYAKALGDAKTPVRYTNALASSISAATGVEMTCTSDAKTTSKPEDPEILVGLTDRAQSAELQKQIKGNGFAIAVMDNKIVIVGSDNILLLQAISFFAKQFLPTADGSTLTVSKNVKANKLQKVLLCSAEGESGTGFSFVLGGDIRTEKNASSAADSLGRDYPAVAAEWLTTTFNKLTKLRAKTYFPTIRDSETAEGTELLIGTVDRDACRAALSQLQGEEYGFFVQDGSFVLTAYNDAALRVGVQEFSELLEDAAVTRDGVLTVEFPEGFCMIGRADEAWVTDFPKPEGEGIVLTNTMDCANDSLQYYYTGDGVSADAYNAYCSTLTQLGYTVLWENEIEQSLYKTLVSADRSHSLYVAYNAYAHQDEFDYDKYDPCIRIVSSPAESVTLPDEGLMTPQPSYDRVTSSAISTLEIMSTAAGMCYVVTLEDGRLIVFDGGGINTNGQEDVDLWNLLVACTERATGKAVSTSNPVHIAAWVLTHPHWDHYAAFHKMFSDRAGSGRLRMDYLLGSFPSETSVYREAEGGLLAYSGTRIANMQKKLSFQFIKTHAGQKFYLANAEIEVLTTYDDLNPHRISTGNDTNTVLRFTMLNTNAAGQRVGEPTTILFAGDSATAQSRYMCAMFGDYLQSDMVQVAHHGNKGCEKDFYTKVAAEVLWFAIFQKHFDLFLSPQWTGSYSVNIHTVKLPSTKYIYVSGNNDDEWGNCNITLPFDAETGMPDYDSIFETMTGDPMPYDNKVAINDMSRFN